MQKYKFSYEYVVNNTIDRLLLTVYYGNDGLLWLTVIG